MSEVIPENVKALRDKVLAEGQTPEPRKSVKEYADETASTHYVMQIGRLSKVIEELRAENEKLRAENEKLVAQSWVVDGALLSEREEIEKLRAALKPFADAWDNRYKHASHNLIRDENLRAARAAYRGEKE